MQIGKLLSALVIIIFAAGCNNANFKKTKGGMPYKLFSSGKGAKLQGGDIMKVHFIQKLDDSVMISTYPTGPRYIPVPPSSYPYDISEVFTQMRKGDSVYAVQMVDTFIKQRPDKVPPNFKNGMKIITTVKVLDVFKNDEEVQDDQAKDRDEAFRKDKKAQEQLAKDVQILNEWLAKNNITGERTAGGTVIQRISPGSGPVVTKGKYVTVKYKGSTLAGTVFDTNMDTSFKHPEPLGFYAGKGRMMRGFDEAVLTMKKGEKVKIYIPAGMAYGSNPPPGGKIGINENLMFDIELLEIMDKAPEQPFGGQGGQESPH
jgi:FKBP-type peptidyl-prolyl cis-trans isomerase FkpA